MGVQMTLARIIPITSGADRDTVILSALKAAHSFITNPSRVSHEGDLQYVEYLLSGSTFDLLDKLLIEARKQMGDES